MRLAPVVGIVAALALAGCASNSFDGVVAGYPLEVADSTFMYEVSSGRGMAIIILEDHPNVCDSFRSGNPPGNATTLTLLLSKTNGVVPGEYLITAVNAEQATAVFAKTDSECKSVIAGQQGLAVQGKVVLDSFDTQSPGKASGSFDLTFDTGDHVTGSFGAAFCSANWASVNFSCGG